MHLEAIDWWIVGGVIVVSAILIVLTYRKMPSTTQRKSP